MPSKILFLFFLSSQLFVFWIWGATGYVFFVDSSFGDDGNDGLSTAEPFRSLEKVNSLLLSPGDQVLFKSNEEWRGTLNVSYSGTIDSPILFSKFGSGQNPIIRSSYMIKGIDWVQESPNIYSFCSKCVDPDWLNPSGLTDSHEQLLPRYKYFPGNVPTTLDYPSSGQSPNMTNLERNMLVGYSWTPKNQGMIYFRWNGDGNPGQMEVGRLQNGIFIRNQSHIVVDSIDVLGPTGSSYGILDTQSLSLVLCIHTPNFSLRNGRVANSFRTGINLRGNSHNGTIENCLVEWVASGISSYSPSGGGSYVNILNNTLDHIASQIWTGGDRHVIGFWGSYWRIEGNRITNHGWNGNTITNNTVLSPGYAIVGCCAHHLNPPGQLTNHIIRDNYFENLARGAIGIHGGDNCEVSNNVISGWALQNEESDATTASAIRFNTHNDYYPQVFNNTLVHNLITRGKSIPYIEKNAALEITGGVNRFLIVNNLVSGNEPHVDLLYMKVNSLGSDNIVEHNLFFGKNSQIVWGGLTYNSSSLVPPNGTSCTLFSSHWQCDHANTSRGVVANNIVEPPLFQDGSYLPKEASPTVDAGKFLHGYHCTHPSTFIENLYAGCKQWAGISPDIGRFEFSNLTVEPQPSSSVISSSHLSSSTRPRQSFSFLFIISNLIWAH